MHCPVSMSHNCRIKRNVNFEHVIQKEKIAYSTSGIVAAADDLVPMYIQAAHTLFVAFQHTQTVAQLDVPHPQCPIPGARHRYRAVMQYAHGADGGSVPV